MEPDTLNLVTTVANIGGMGAFSVLVYIELRALRQVLSALAPRVRVIEVETHERLPRGASAGEA